MVDLRDRTLREKEMGEREREERENKILSLIVFFIFFL
jgi:hypothetical protein